MLTHLLAVGGVVAACVVYGLVMRGAHEHQKAEKRRLGISCGSCSDGGCGGTSGSCSTRPR